jgi:hypothetical protein
MFNNLFKNKVNSQSNSHSIDSGYQARGEMLQACSSQSNHPIKNVNDISKKSYLEEYFDGVIEGPGIWKWRHYFEIYERHISKFRGSNVKLMEIGVYSGGSLRMWNNYFGSENLQLYGCDIEKDCKTYESSNTTVFIGDQGDREFWRQIKSKTSNIDIIIDDGSHIPEHQMITIEEMLPALAPGGVYICEDIHGTKNHVWNFVFGLIRKFNHFDVVHNLDDNANRLISIKNDYQKCIHSIHIYTYLLVIEKNAYSYDQFIAPKHGTQWQPFLK